jgi:dTDP-4-amino-4,6-dideoxygalactose transaminase
MKSVAEELAISGGTRTITAQHRRWPEITGVDRRHINAVLDSNVLCGPLATEVTALQEEWSEYCGTRFCLAVNTGTAALHCAAAAVGVEPGDEVIVPAFSFVATAFGMAHQGAVPVFCDVAPDTFNIDSARIEERITDRTKAVVPVHMHGLPADMDEINAIAGRHGLAVIEDAAQAHGARYEGRRTGGLARVGCFSMNASKNLPAGEGGLLTTDDEEVYTIARHLAIFGEDVRRLGPGEFRSYRSHGLGWNYRLSEITAALARAQLLRLDAVSATAKRNAKILGDGLAAVPGLVPPVIPEGRTSSYHKYRVRIDTRAIGFAGSAAELRDRLLLALRAEGVGAVLWHTDPLPSYPAFRRPLKPWSPQQGLVEPAPWDPGEYPIASALLDSSLVLGTETEPIFFQEPEVVHQYVAACSKVMRNLDAVLATPCRAERPR